MEDFTVKYSSQPKIPILIVHRRSFSPPSWPLERANDNTKDKGQLPSSAIGADRGRKLGNDGEVRGVGGGMVERRALEWSGECESGAGSHLSDLVVVGCLSFQLVQVTISICYLSCGRS
jgi:hypothetical protein